MKREMIFQLGDRAIRAKSKKITEPQSQKNQQLIKNMIRLMHREHLVGIAAPQLGINQRIFLTQPRSTEFRNRQAKGKVRIYINPRILKKSKIQQTAYEGCGSVAHAGIFGKVPRSQTVTIMAQDQDGTWFTLNASGFFARIIQHEYDHLEGRVFLDRVKDTRSLLGQESYLRRLK